jgi:hypothetical protein
VGARRAGTWPGRLRWLGGRRDLPTNAALAAWFGAADTQRVKESPGRAGALGSIEEPIGSPDSISKRETRYHPKALRRAIKKIEMRGLQSLTVGIMLRMRLSLPAGFIVPCLLRHAYDCPKIALTAIVDQADNSNLEDGGVLACSAGGNGGRKPPEAAAGEGTMAMRRPRGSSRFCPRPGIFRWSQWLMAWGRWLQPTNLNKSRRSIKGLGDLPPQPPPACLSRSSRVNYS